MALSPSTRAAGAWPTSRAVRPSTKAVSSGVSAQQYSERQPCSAKAVSVRSAGWRPRSTDRSAAARAPVSRRSQVASMIRARESQASVSGRAKSRRS
jgi:hypothetical protein